MSKKKQKLNEVVVLPVLLFHDILNLLEIYHFGSEGPTYARDVTKLLVRLNKMETVMLPNFKEVRQTLEDKLATLEALLFQPK